VYIRVQYQSPVCLPQAYREKGCAGRSVEDGVALLEVLKLRDDPFVTWDFSEAVAGLLGFLAGSDLRYLSDYLSHQERSA
jgi:hypothetical protein